MYNSDSLARSWERSEYFNSHPHEEDDHVEQYVSQVYLYFNSHPHEEDDTQWPGRDIWTWLFQLTSSWGGWRYVEALPPTDLIFQLTSSRGGWPRLSSFVSSICIFQLTSSRGGWQRRHDSFSLSYIISTHILTRRMTSMDSLPFVFLSISTHILTRRMTIPQRLSNSPICHFNSHPHEEDDK